MSSEWDEKIRGIRSNLQHMEAYLAMIEKDEIQPLSGFSIISKSAKSVAAYCEIYAPTEVVRDDPGKGEVGLSGTREWFERTFASRLGCETPVVIVKSRIHEEDEVGVVELTEGDFPIVRLDHE